MSGYFRMSADEWEPEHYRGRWSPENRAPRWWAWADAAWYIDRRRLPAARKLAEEWGWTKSTAYAFARSVAIEQRAWELRPDVRAYLDGLIAPDKTRTGTVELQGQDSDTRGPSNADNYYDARTETGHSSDTSRTVLGHLTGARSESTSSPASTAPAVDTQEAPAPAVAPSAPRKPDPTDALHAVYRGHRPRVAVTPTPDSRKALRRILAECGDDLDAAAVYLAWTFTSQDQHAQQLRGEAPWPGGQVLARCDVVSLSRNVPPRLAAAQAWEARGRRDAPQVVTFAHPQPRAQVPKTEGLLRHLHQRFLESTNAD